MGYIREDGEMVIKLDAKRLLVLGVIVAITVFSLYGYITAIFAFIAPSESYPLRVTQVATFSTGDAVKTSFIRGETVRIKATVEKATGYYFNSYVYYYPYTYYDSVSTTYRIVFAVIDGGRGPVFFVSNFETIWPGESLVTSHDFTIPSTSSTGTYSVRVVAWSEWLPQGVALAPDAGATSFTVSGG